jgi:protein phosphatase
MIRYAAVTDKGIREGNDDRILVDCAILGSGSKAGDKDDAILAAVFDGVGGEAFGAEAAQQAAEALSSVSSISAKDDAVHAAERANAAVLAAQAQDDAHSRMACTLAGIFVDGDRVVIFNVGDSKVYRFREPYIALLSVDHTYAKAALQLGLVKDKGELTEKNQHRITRCLGDETEWKPDVYEGKSRTGDVYLLCSDGLSDVVDDDVMEKILSQAASLETKCKQLLTLAGQLGSQDNISIIIVEVG